MTKFATVFCDNCKHEFSMDSVDIQTTTVKLGRHSLDLNYFACPKCNKIYRISLKDERCEEFSEDIKRTKKRIRKIYGSGNYELANRLDAMLRQKTLRFKNYIDKLNKKFPGTFVFEVSESGEKIIKYLP